MFYQREITYYTKHTPYERLEGLRIHHILTPSKLQKSLLLNPVHVHLNVSKLPLPILYIRATSRYSGPWMVETPGDNCVPSIYQSFSLRQENVLEEA